MEWLSKAPGSLVAKVIEALWGSLARRIYGDRELASKFRLDIVKLYAEGPAMLCLKALAPMDDVTVEAITVDMDGDWRIMRMGQKAYDGTHLAEYGAKWESEMALHLSVSDLMAAQGPYTGASFSFFVAPWERSKRQGPPSPPQMSPILGPDGFHASLMSGSKPLAIIATLTEVSRARRQTFVKLTTQPAAQAAVVPKRMP